MKKALTVMVLVPSLFLLSACSTPAPHEGMVRYNDQWVTQEEYARLHNGDTPASPAAPTPAPPAAAKPPTVADSSGKSDTDLVIDTVLTFIRVNSGNDKYPDLWDYWYGGYEAYDEFASAGDGGGRSILTHLDFCYSYEEDGKAEFNLPTIQDNYAILNVTLNRARLTDVKRNAFRFNLKKDAAAGWGITDIRLIYTEDDNMKPYVSD